MSTLGNRLKRAREKANKTQGDVCKTLGISIGTLSGYERDYRKPDAEMIRRLAELYEVTADYLLGLTNDPKGTASSIDDSASVSPEEREFLDWVKKHVTGQFFYDFHQSQDKEAYMKSLRLVYELEKGRKPGQRQGE
jgi:transcriptional regulator with XRE-family HTH domain